MSWESKICAHTRRKCMKENCTHYQPIREEVHLIGALETGLDPAVHKVLVPSKCKLWK
jgi:hypothetical protein